MSYLNIAKRVILEESESLGRLSDTIESTDFEKVVQHILTFKGRIILTGIGKSGHIARKIAASFASTGTAALYIHPAEASHGDLGMITEEDLVIMLSNSGETKELVDIINYCKRFAIKIVAMTMQKNSNLAAGCNFLLLIPKSQEASLIAAPTTSALMMLALGDALTITVQEAKGFSQDDFLVYHPGGKIGANLQKVRDLMHTGDKLPIVHNDTSFAETIITMTRKSFGCAIVVDDHSRILGVVTDGDLRRHINYAISMKYARDIMTTKPITIDNARLAAEALSIMNNHKITALPVTEKNNLVGIIHIHDLLRAGVG